MAFKGVVSRSWNLYRPSRRVCTRPAASSTSRCCETACRDEPTPCLVISRVHSSNSVWPLRSWSSSRIARRVGSARALNTSPTAGRYASGDLPDKGRRSERRVGEPDGVQLLLAVPVPVDPQQEQLEVGVVEGDVAPGGRTGRAEHEVALGGTVAVGPGRLRAA